MPGTTIPDASLFTKDRGRPAETFDLTFTYEGIDIIRPGEPARHLPWARITEWEIEQRRGGVLLTLRGSGSVTPLIIPKWRVDDLDEVLREVTSGVPVPVSTMAPAPAPVTPPAVTVPPVVETPEFKTPVVVQPEPAPMAEPVIEDVPVEEAPVAFSDRYAEPFDVASTWSAPAPEAAPEPDVADEAPVEPISWSEPEPTAPAPPAAETAPVEAEEEEVTTNLWGDEADQEGLDTVLWPEPRVPRLTGPRPDGAAAGTETAAWTVDDPSFASAIESGPAMPQDDEVDSSLEWPSDQPLDDMPKLEWPGGAEKKSPTDKNVTDAPAAAPAESSAAQRSTPWAIAEVEDLPPAVPTAMIPVVEPIVRPPARPMPERTVKAPTPMPERTATAPSPMPERTATAPSPMPERTATAADLLASEFGSDPTSPAPRAAAPKAAPVATPTPTALPRTERRKQARMEVSWKSAGTAALLALLAAAVAIVLADSAGAIHLGFLGS